MNETRSIPDKQDGIKFIVEFGEPMIAVVWDPITISLSSLPDAGDDALEPQVAFCCRRVETIENIHLNLLPLSKMVNGVTRETFGRGPSAPVSSSFNRDRRLLHGTTPTTPNNHKRPSSNNHPPTKIETYRLSVAAQQEHRGPLNQPYSPTTTSLRQAAEDLVCDYDQNVTPLYELLESSQWDQARLKSRTHPEQVQTWIVRRDEKRTIKWKLLPLHAAVIFQAPIVVTEALLQEYPEAIEKRDDQGMVALHLAFRHTMDDTLMELLLHRHPSAISVQDKRGRIPLDHAGERVFSGAFLKAYTTAACQNISSSQIMPEPVQVPDTTVTRAHYEGIIASLHEQHEESLLRMHETIEEEKESMRVYHQKELKDLRNQAARREKANSIEAYQHLQEALQIVSAENQTLRSQLQEQEAYNEQLQSQMKHILHDQMTMTTYCEQQQQELNHAKRIREELLKTLSAAQKEASSSSAVVNARQISQLSESIRLRTEALLQDHHPRSEPTPQALSSPKSGSAAAAVAARPATAGAAAALSSPTARRGLLGTARIESTYGRNDLGWGGSMPDANDGDDDGDDVSAITDDNNYNY